MIALKSMLKNLIPYSEKISPNGEEMTHKGCYISLHIRENTE